MKTHASLLDYQEKFDAVDFDIMFYFLLMFCFGVELGSWLPNRVRC